MKISINGVWFFSVMYPRNIDMILFFLPTREAQSTSGYMSYLFEDFKVDQIKDRTIRGGNIQALLDSI